ncbi:hypothetical protein F0562_022343 [Nyssa sinensis]|uniref:Uncharacterized protein n=1 Tax=Nyssa sinensis TaxID=561372 RepID=A0A5J5BSW6_9ASTE|nr:hypothetical protein F0562_022343 [Nyssa sinensis]
MTESAPVAAGGGGGRKDEWATEFQPISAGLEVSRAERFGLGLEDWESLLSESGQDQSLLRWIVGDIDDASFGLKQLLQASWRAATAELWKRRSVLKFCDLSHKPLER